MPKRVTSPTKRRKDILKRMVYYRDAQARRRRDPQNDETKNTKGELLDAALSYVEVAKQQQAMRDEDWATTHRAINNFSNLYSREVPVPAGGSPKGYSKPKRMPEPWPWENSPRPMSPQESLFQAAACILAELERMQYTDEVALGYKKPPEPKTWTIDVPTWTSPVWTTQDWADEASTITFTPNVNIGTSNATGTINGEASSLVLST